MLATILLFVGCSNTKEGTEVTNVNVGEEFKLGESLVVVDSVTKELDYKGEPSIVVEYSWTNNSEATTNWLVFAYDQVFQDGVELGMTINKEEEFKAANDVVHGTTINGIKSVFTPVSEGDLEVLISPFDDITGEEETIVIKVDFPE